MQAKDCPALAADLVLLVGREQEGHHRPGRSGCGLYDMGDNALTGRLVEVLERGSRMLLVGP